MLGLAALMKKVPKLWPWPRTPFAGWKKIEILSREGQNVHLYQVFDDDPTALVVVIEQFVPEIMRRSRSIYSIHETADHMLQVSENNSVKIWIMFSSRFH